MFGPQRLTATLLACCFFLYGCATPPVFVKASSATPEMDLRFESIECSRLAELLALEKKTELRLAEEMASRAAKQLVLNTIGVAALAFGGFGIAHTIRGEGDRRDALATTRGEIVVMQKVLTEKRCRPDGTGADVRSEAAGIAQNAPTFMKQADADVVNAQLAGLGGANCTGDMAAPDADSLLKRGRLLASLNQYEAAMQCLLRAVDQGSGSLAYRDSCEFIASMYEFGWGVAKNPDTAKLWIGKANL